MRFWCRNEWAKGWMDNPNFVNRLTGNKRCWGNFDKGAHLFLHFLIIIMLVIIFHRSLWLAIVISEGWGILWECLDWVRGNGASKMDLLANNLGMIMGVIFMLLGGVR